MTNVIWQSTETVNDSCPQSINKTDQMVTYSSSSKRTQQKRHWNFSNVKEKEILQPIRYQGLLFIIS